MSDAADAGASQPSTVRVAVDCQGPIGGHCHATLVGRVHRPETNDVHRGIRCDDCGRVTHATKRHIVPPGGEEP